MMSAQSDPNDFKTVSDEILLNACRQGDARAWEQVLDRYERLVFSIARNNGLTATDAADITQVTFSILLKSIDAMSDEGNLRAWLATVARRHSRRMLVRQLRYVSTDIEAVTIEGLYPVEAGQDSIERWELAEWIRSGLERIDERCRRLLRALYFDTSEPSYLQIAEMLGIAEGSIGPIRARCLARMRQAMESEQGDSG